MGQKLHRVVRACAELGAENPILSIHDQGAGGNGSEVARVLFNAKKTSTFPGNVLKELVEGGGAVISADNFELGDETISARELWTAEYQVGRLQWSVCLQWVALVTISNVMRIARRLLIEAGSLNWFPISFFNFLINVTIFRDETALICLWQSGAALKVVNWSQREN